MANIDNIIELKRGLHKICNRDLVNTLAELEEFEEFYCNIFHVYELVFNTETIRQKRVFTAAITKYFLLDRLPQNSLTINENKYEAINPKEIKEQLINVVDIFYTIHKTSISHDDFKKKYAEHFNEELKDFSKEISETRDESLSDFAKLIQNVYNNSKDEN